MPARYRVEEIVLEGETLPTFWAVFRCDGNDEELVATCPTDIHAREIARALAYCEPMRIELGTSGGITNYARVSFSVQ